VAWQHVALVRELRLPPVPKLLLFALASRADNQGRCWPSVRRICLDSGLSRRAVQIHLGQLIASGLVLCESRVGRSNRLRLVLGPFEANTDARPTAITEGSREALEARTSCAPPAHDVRTLAHRMRRTGVSRAPEVEREESNDIHEKAAGLCNPVDKPATATLSMPWWHDRSAVMLKGVELGVSPNPGEDYRTYKDRVFKAWQKRTCRPQR
jgi:hypothetical protein